MIEGERVSLRALEKADLELVHKWVNDSEVMRHARYQPEHMQSFESVAKEYEEELKERRPKERRTLVVLEKATGRAIGLTIIRTWDHKHISATVGILLGEKDHWGKGLGTEAMELLLTVVFDHLAYHRADLFTTPENERAVKSFRKVGFREVGREREVLFFDGKYHDSTVMELLRSEWEARRG